MADQLTADERDDTQERTKKKRGVKKKKKEVWRKKVGHKGKEKRG